MTDISPSAAPRQTDPLPLEPGPNNALVVYILLTPPGLRHR